MRELLPVSCTRRRIIVSSDRSSRLGGCGHAASEASFKEQANSQSCGAGARCSRTDFFAHGKRIGVGTADGRPPAKIELRTIPGDGSQRRRARRHQPRHLPSRRRQSKPRQPPGACAGMRRLWRVPWLRRMQRLRRMQGLQRLRRRLRRWLRGRMRGLRRRRDRRAVAIARDMHRLLCLVGPLPLVLGGSPP
jgi:hypothetical protein